MDDYLRMQFYAEARNEELRRATTQAQKAGVAKPRQIGRMSQWIAAITVILLGMIAALVR